MWKATFSHGTSRAIDYLGRDKEVDPHRVAIFGVSRLGKTVLWAGARDARIALVNASCSGEGGASLSRRSFGETIRHLMARCADQCCGNDRNYEQHPEQLPVDSHTLPASIAPRPVLLQTGDQDLWSDPKGEFLAAVAGGPVFRLLGAQDLGADQWPPAGAPLLNTPDYSMHSGGHGAMPADWSVFRNFPQQHLDKPLR